MSRKYIDCREFPSDSKCTVAIAADSDAELLDAWWRLSFGQQHAQGIR